MVKVNFPFSAVSGQQTFKLALILAAINPTIGGVLVSGPRGSAKSTLARGMADILPGNQHDFVTLPLGASEEMLIGTLDLQQVLADKKVSFNPGLLAKAHQGVLYVDEVNLLPDMLVDLLLDVATSGVNCIERDGISHSHESQFILLGTMNPDEGELRAQLLDRFGLSVELSNQYEVAERIEIVKLTEQFSRDPEKFISQYADEQAQLTTKVVQARSLLSGVQCADKWRELIAVRCNEANVDGLRGDIVWYKAACAHAAWQNRLEVNQEDVLAVEELVLSHRRQQSSPPPNNGSGYSKPPPSSNSPSSEQNNTSGQWGSMPPTQQKTAQHVAVELPNLAVKSVANSAQPASKKSSGAALGGSKAGINEGHQPNWFSTLISAKGLWPPTKLRFKKPSTGTPVLNMVLLDTSGSTLNKRQFAKAKAVVVKLAEQAYRLRQQLCVFGFGDEQVSELIAKAKAPKSIAQQMDEATAGGGTPLLEMLKHAVDYQQKLLKGAAKLSINTFLITDGRVKQNVDHIRLFGESVLLDIEDAPVKRGRGKVIAAQLGFKYVSVPSN